MAPPVREFHQPREDLHVKAIRYGGDNNLRKQRQIERRLVRGRFIRALCIGIASEGKGGAAEEGGGGLVTRTDGTGTSIFGIIGGE